MMTKHTPGPWVVNKLDPDDQIWDIDAPNGDPTLGYKDWSGMVEVYGCDDEPEKGRLVATANARLIAAAPDLLDALENLCIGIGMGWDLEGMAEVAQKAIAKATGSVVAEKATGGGGE